MSTIPSLVDVAWLNANLTNPNLVIVDTRWYLMNPPQGDLEYAESHISGAIYLSIDRDLSAAPFDGPGRHPLPASARVIETFSSAGIDATTHVVVYDSAGGSVATRLWWMLRYYGHTAVSILDGGWQAWQAAGGATTAGIERRAARTFVGSPDPTQLVDADTVQEVSNWDDLVLLDARAHERYTGAVEPFGPRAGHIPGALSMPFAGNLTEAGTFKSIAELTERYAAAGIPSANHIICYCGSGVTATHDIFALHLIGRHARLYQGSWSDWSSTNHRPIQTGEHP
jgi:thiosulfate/3-mercaptopyruvate sulfurtransferase